MKEEKFEDLLQHELQDLYDAEQQILEALPKMSEAASSEELAAAFDEHRRVTEQQVRRLDKIFKAMGQKPGGETCMGMQGLIKEGQKLIKEIGKSPVLDAALIGAAQKVEHYEIAGYGTVCAMAEMLGQGDAAKLLAETLAEEKETDETLTEIAETIMVGEAAEDEEDEEEGEEIEDEGEEENVGSDKAR